MQNYKNITVDLTNCDKEPIHIIGRVQPHGFLMVLHKTTLTIEQVSENVGLYLESDVEDLLGKSLHAIISAEEMHTLERVFTSRIYMNPLLLHLRERAFFGFIYESADKYILECEPYSSDSDKVRLQQNCYYSHLQSELNNLSSQEELAKLITDYVQALLDYDRVMLYMFDQEWNGEVIAETVKPGVHSFLHHHFPASDIPAPARALLLRKHVRQIPDINAAAVDIVPYFNPTSGKPTNIIQSELRNPSEIHLEYLRNMQVGATLSVSIIVKGKLWGLITCHNLSPVFIDSWKREMCLLAAKALANMIPSIEETRDFNQFEAYKATEAKLIDQLYNTGEITRGLFESETNLLSLASCTGAAMFYAGKISLKGATPTAEQVQELIGWVTENATDSIFHTRELSRQFGQARPYKDVASGLLALEISKPHKEYILLFKPEIKETKIWAGKPDKVYTGDDMRIHPRKSFANWQEVVKGKSQPWSLNELDIAQLFLKDLQAFRLHSQAASLQRLNTELQETTDDLKQKNARLEDFAQIIAHNLRSPMNNIRGLYELYQITPDEETCGEVMDRVNTMAGNMLDTIQDLYDILHTTLNQNLAQDEVLLEELVKKEIQNLTAVIAATEADIKLELQAPKLYIPKVYMESIVHNLLSNALKYSAADRKPVIQVKSSTENGLFIFSVEDNGLGLDLEKVGSKLFGLYKTFHVNKDSKGLGLYLTKLQVESLGGSILVNSTVDAGTKFTVILGTPAN
ncbi:GAF domain-containing protein [Pontibacter sp. SGAir0037]|uniref:GAF domain-containing protein n=1 Tax=Pontibacter sp. SGAir0037 TaxID=2571030 RepID=UPI0010CD0DAF|nr:GAF domain-containing protein [Pontibacter sp. SGAir0037]QCR21398.1 hypothetical protein C1N53_02895 [Pontibacter sp. SGAir0037]